jgi:hypothetical protein
MKADTQPGTNRYISADFFTPSYRIVGKIAIPSTGLMGLVNDPMTSFMEIHDARLARLHMPTKLVDHYETVRLVRSQVFAICLARREDIGPHIASRTGYARSYEYRVLMTTPVYELTGIVEWSGRFDFSVVMVDGKSDFVPLYNTMLTAILIQALKVESPALLFNRKHIDLMALNSHHIDEP